jgi:hypothetical protein
VYADSGKSARDGALVILYYIYPKRMSRDTLTATLLRHPFKKANASTAVQRIQQFIDDDGNDLIKLRNSGLRKVEELFAKGAK